MRGIYRIHFGDKIYVGSSVNIAQRVKQHVARLRRGAHVNKHMQALWRKYGERDMVVHVTELDVETAELRGLEADAIRSVPPSLRINSTAETKTPFDDSAVRQRALASRMANPDWARNAAEGRARSASFVAAARRSGLANAHHLKADGVAERRVANLRTSEKHKAAHAIRAQKLARPDVRAKRLEACRNSEVARDSARRMQAALAARRCKPVRGSRLDDGRVEVFSSASEAALAVGGSQGNISTCARGGRDTAYGRRREYV